VGARPWIPGPLVDEERAWSTTFKALRAERQEWTIERLRKRDPEATRWRPTTRYETDWQFAGVGWASEADQVLADTRRQQRAEARLLAREACREGRVEGRDDLAHEAKPPSGGAAAETE
jgi:Replication initiator protein, pSAM2